MGSQVNTSGIKTFTASEALAIHRRVKLTTASGTAVEYADAGEKGIGITEDAAASGAPVAVKLWNAPGSRKVVANEALAVTDTIYGDDDGKVSNDASGSALFSLLEAASDDGAIVEALVL